MEKERKTVNHPVESNDAAPLRFRGKIDFQSHYLPPAYLEFLRAHYPGSPDGYPTPDYWTPDWQRDKMDLLGIAYAHLELSSPNVFLLQADDCLRLARKINDQGAAIVAENPTRFGLIATLPLPWAEASAEEARRTLDELKADGVGLTTNHHGVYLGDPRLDPVMRELDGRGAMAIVHPTAPHVSVPGACEGLSLPAFEYFVETTRAFTNMVLEDTFVKFPNIRWVMPHAGAFVSVLADRFESFAFMLRFADPDRRVDYMDAMSHVYYDLAGFSEPKQLADLLRNVPDTHLLYGSDTPYTPIEAVLSQARALEGTDKLTEEQKRMAFTGNALAVNPKLAGIPALARAASEPAGNVAVKRDGRWHVRLLRDLFPRRHVAVRVPVPPHEAAPKIAGAVRDAAAARLAPDPCDDPALTARYDVRLNSPVGVIAIPVIVSYDDMTRTSFHGKAKVMGIVASYRDGVRDGTRHSFDIRVRLPFGPLTVHLNADVSEPDGSVAGTAVAPHRRPMPFTGRRR
ncbi:amidohydrolase family protein [Bifidobacterium catulorum]|uniref:6-methylsalicylate decarboxylase n=1 Tax=Bifidobacterium catulorum TaxID=1630173 RepID=A0A2U2MV10_9BIFI|nr:amidohydrolase family protein [Bifidobacterium catulorum]PWG60703.1 hypothetical protein DF200_00225 [Bifidobacterium catulorum]